MSMPTGVTADKKDDQWRPSSNMRATAMTVGSTRRSSRRSSNRLMPRRLLGYGRQSVDRSDVVAVVEVLQSDFLTQGPMIERFESALADRCGVRYAVAVSNGTAALHLAYLA